VILPDIRSDEGWGFIFVRHHDWNGNRLGNIERFNVIERNRPARAEYAKASLRIDQWVSN